MALVRFLAARHGSPISSRCARVQRQPYAVAGRPAARRVKGALLVAPCDIPVTEALHAGHLSFGTMPTEALPFPSITIGSLNDIYMRLDRLTLFGRLWNSDVRNIGLAGHINIASGFGRWPSGYGFLEILKSRSRHRQPQGFSRAVAVSI